MIRFVLRALGFCCVGAAFAALVVDGTRSIAGGRVLQYGLGDAAAWIAGSPAAGFSGTLAGAPAPVSAVAAAVLALPVWSAGAALGLGLLLAGRSTDTPTGFSDRGA